MLTLLLLNLQMGMSFSMQEPIAAMKNKRQSATAIAYGEIILVIGGYKGSGAKSNEVEMYIPSENRWLELDRKF